MGRRDLWRGISSPGQFLLHRPLDDQENAICTIQISPVLHQSLSWIPWILVPVPLSSGLACLCLSESSDGGGTLPGARAVALPQLGGRGMKNNCDIHASHRRPLEVLSTRVGIQAAFYFSFLFPRPAFTAPVVRGTMMAGHHWMSTLSCSSGGSDLSVPNIFHAATW